MLSIQLDTRSIRSRYAADTQPIRNGTERIMQATEEDGKTLFLKITKDHDGDCFLTLGRPTHELLAEEGEEQVEEQEGRGKRARKPKPQAEVHAKSPKKKKGSPKKKGK